MGGFILGVSLAIKGDDLFPSSAVVSSFSWRLEGERTEIGGWEVRVTGLGGWGGGGGGTGACRGRGAWGRTAKSLCCSCSSFLPPSHRLLAMARASPNGRYSVFFISWASFLMAFSGHL